MSRLKRSELIVAIIGLIGVLATGIFSNWDKLFNNVVQATSFYRPTDNLETEVRHYFDVSGARQGIELMQSQMLEQMKLQAMTAQPEEAAEIQRVYAVVEKEKLRFDDVMREILPIYQKHFSLPEIQELNRFYSTEIMQGMIKKTPLLARELAPIQVKLFNEYMDRVTKKIDEELHNE